MNYPPQHPHAQSPGYPQPSWQSAQYPPPRRRRTGLVIGVVATVVLLLATLAVTGFVAPGFLISDDDRADDRGERPAAPTSGEMHPAPNNPHPRVARPKDRDPAAVAGALKVIDTCKLLAKDSGGKRGRLVPSGPHSCALLDGTDPGSERIWVDAGVGFPHGDRYLAEQRELGGVKVYVMWEDGVCYLNVPVSAKSSIQFTADPRSEADSCDVVERAAKAGVAKLAGGPDSVIAKGAPAPFADWDTCELLAAALGEVGDRVLSYGLPVGTGSTCMALPPGADVGAGGHEGIELQISYDYWDPADTSSTIGGRAAAVESSASGCEVKLDHGQSGVGDKWHASTVVTLTGKPTCDELSRFAENLVSAERAGPPRSDVEPLRQLTYRPDEPDTDQAGACAHFGPAEDQADCEPYHHVDRPGGGLAGVVQAAVEPDRNVLCAAALGAVDKHYEQPLDPLTFRDACYFVEPTHRVQFAVSLYRDPPSGLAVGEICDATETLDVAGTAAFTCTKARDGSLSVYLSLVDDIDQPGALVLTATALTPPGDLDAEPSADGAELAVANEVAADVVRENP